MILIFSAITAFTQTKSQEFPSEIPDNWKLFFNDEFSFYAPDSLENRNLRGKDSFIGKYTNEEMEIRFDYGWFCNSCGTCDKPVIANVDNKSAAICTYEDKEAGKDKKYVKSIRFSKLDFNGQTTLALWVKCKTIQCQTDAEKIIRSIKFKQKKVKMK